MKCKSAILIPLIFISPFCASTDKKVERPSQSQYDSLTFFANVEKAYMNSISENYLWGFKYDNNRIIKLPDSVEITIGNDAHYGYKLTDLEYLDPNQNSINSNALSIVIHSPTKTFGSEPIIRKKYKFILFYSKGNDPNIRFIFLRAEGLN